MSKVTQEFSAVGDEKIANAYRKMAEQVVNLEDKVNRLTQATQRSAEQTTKHHTMQGSMVEKQITRLGTMAMSWLSVSKAIEAANIGLARTIALERSASNAQHGMARGQAEVFFNMSGSSRADKDFVLKESLRISRETGIDPGIVQTNIGRQMSRGPEMDKREIIKAQTWAARLTRHMPEQLEPVGSAIQQMMRIGKMSADDAAALGLSGMANSFIGDPAQQGRNLSQSVGTAAASVPNANGKTVEQIIEMVNAAGQIVGEERGESSRTAMGAVAAQAEEFRQGRGAWATAAPWGGKARNIPVTGAPTQPQEFFEWLNANPAQGKKFWDKATFERQYEAPLREMFKSGTPQNEIYKKMQTQVFVNRGALETTAAEMAGGTDPLKSKSESDVTKMRDKLYTSGRTIRARQDEARKIMFGTDEEKGTLDLTSDYAWQPEWMEQFGNWFGSVTQSPEELAYNTLRYRAGQIRGRVRPDASGKLMPENVVGGLGSIPTPDSMLTAGQRSALDLVDAQVKRLEEIRDEIKLLRKEDGKRVPSAGPALNGQKNHTNER